MQRHPCAYGKGSLTHLSLSLPWVRPYGSKDGWRPKKRKVEGVLCRTPVACDEGTGGSKHEMEGSVLNVNSSCFSSQQADHPVYHQRACHSGRQTGIDDLAFLPARSIEAVHRQHARSIKLYTDSFCCLHARSIEAVHRQHARSIEAVHRQFLLPSIEAVHRQHARVDVLTESIEAVHRQFLLLDSTDRTKFYKKQGVGGRAWGMVWVESIVVCQYQSNLIINKEIQLLTKFGEDRIKTTSIIEQTPCFILEMH
ncbi:hypothetical protein DPMN_001795 [Dreissena polymorpha]|uniref:Uncharacterized protein n=1 Tax=Dreissena polymorpha TaxID=45954 RepID=A0A9D4MKQ9_DREPO|nr:hypothetical protein DPMN_001795 [Dreissena polymorpha]